MKLGSKCRTWTWLAMLCVTALATAAMATGTAQTGGKTDSCRTFVQEFYRWYCSGTDDKDRACDRAMKYKANEFSPQLLSQLKADSAAQDKAKGESVGLDFDPFLATNDDPYESYVVGKITAKGSSHWVDILGIHDGKKSTTPAVVAELISKNGHWMFVNFHYGKSEFPENENLLSILKVLRQQRETTTK